MQKNKGKQLKVKNFEMNQTINYPVDVHQCQCEAQYIIHPLRMDGKW